MADTQRKSREQRKLNDQANNRTSSSSVSPNRAKRNLWWHETPSEKKVPFQAIPKYEVQPKIEARSSWAPSVSQKKIETRKLKWEVSPVLNTHENIRHVPGGGNKKYPTQQLVWNTNHKIDTGFLYDSNGQSNSEA